MKKPLLAVWIILLVIGIPAMIMATSQPVRAEQVEFNMAGGKTVGVSGSFNNNFSGANALDGDVNTCWASAVDTKEQWLYVDLGTVMSIDEIRISWFDKYYAVDYAVGTSDDLTNWQFIHTQTNGTGGLESIPCDLSARYVGILCREKNDIAYAISEFEVYRFVPEVFTFEVSPFIVNPDTNTQELTTARLLVNSGNERLQDISLDAATNIVTIETAYDSYEIILEKGGYFSLCTQISVFDLVNASFSPVLNKKSNALNPNSFHISTTDYLKDLTIDTIKMSGNYGFVKNSDRHIVIVDFTDIYNPVIMTEIAQEVDNYTVNENYLVTYNHELGEVFIYSHEDKTSPILLNTIQGPFEYASFFIDDTRLLIHEIIFKIELGGLISQIYVYDLFDIENIALQHSFEDIDYHSVNVHDYKNNIITFFFVEEFFSPEMGGYYYSTYLASLDISKEQPVMKKEYVTTEFSCYTLSQTEKYLYCQAMYGSPDGVVQNIMIFDKINIGLICEYEYYSAENTGPVSLAICGIDNYYLKCSFRKDLSGNYLSLVSVPTDPIKSFALNPTKMITLNNHAVIVFQGNDQILMVD